MFTTVSFLVTRLPELDNRSAWEAFEARYSPMLRRYFKKAGNTSDVAYDLAQDTMQRAVAGLKEGRFEKSSGRLRHWIGGIARNVLRNHRRHASHRASAQTKTGFWSSQEDPHAEEERLQADAHFDALWVRHRLSSLLRAASKNFSVKDLRCYFLVEVRGLPIKEVARRTQLSETSVFQKRRRVANWFLAMGPRFISQWEK
ncbi:MAG: sigma-70 family RNA polymerase sigma factor [Planctomycetes bacterium]|nr:sigma-70 family RNA polymerase sigma factor [Planctomycetota bacterium]